MDEWVGWVGEHVLRGKTKRLHQFSTCFAYIPGQMLRGALQLAYRGSRLQVGGVEKSSLASVGGVGLLS